MSRKITRAAVPRMVPSLASVAAVLILSTATATATASADSDAGMEQIAAGNGVVVLLPADGLAAGQKGPTRVFVDDVERPFQPRLEIPAGKRTLKFVYEDGNTLQETILLHEGEVRNLAPVACAYDPGRHMGGAPPPPVEPRSGGCCGGTAPSHNVGFDLRVLAAAAVAAAFTARRRRG